MKTLDEINNEIKFIKELIFCQENGNDSYYSSPLYHRHLLQLEALEHERDVLSGKSSPDKVDFKDCSVEKQILLNSVAKKNGYWFAKECREYNNNEIKQINKDAQRLITKKTTD